MKLFSKGDFYLGMDKEKFCDFDIHVGRFVLQYTCPAGQIKQPPLNDGARDRSMEGPTD
jgi:hypothetical protein